MVLFFFVIEHSARRNQRVHRGNRGRLGTALRMSPAADAWRLMVRSPGKLLKKDAILAAVWKNTIVEENSLTRAVTLLRKQLGDDPRNPTFIETVPTLGYRFVAKVDVAKPVPTSNAPATANTAGPAQSTSTAAPTADPAAMSVPASPPVPHNRPKHAWISVPLLVLLAALMTYWLAMPRSPPSCVRNPLF